MKAEEKVIKAKRILAKQSEYDEITDPDMIVVTAEQALDAMIEFAEEYHTSQMKIIMKTYEGRTKY